jgi:hypothetical protein
VQFFEQLYLLQDVVLALVRQFLKDAYHPLELRIRGMGKYRFPAHLQVIFRDVVYNRYELDDPLVYLTLIELNPGIMARSKEDGFAESCLTEAAFEPDPLNPVIYRLILHNNPSLPKNPFKNKG